VAESPNAPTPRSVGPNRGDRDFGDLAARMLAMPLRPLGSARRLAGRALDGVVDRVVEAVDVDEVVRRVDVDEVVKRIDVDDVVKRIEVEQVAERVDVEAIVARSAGALPRHGLDAVRRTLRRLDALSDRTVGRAVGPRPVAPTELATSDLDDGRGRYAGPISRLTGYVIDTSLVGAGYGLLLGAIAVLWGALTNRNLTLPAHDSLLWTLGLIAWGFVYYFAGWALSGQTIGQSLCGVAVVRRDGSTLPPGRAAMRVLAYPTTALLVPLVGVVVGRERRALHDVFADSTVIYD
jgi:uncharacterized RDD family membrane protein YckC